MWLCILETPGLCKLGTIEMKVVWAGEYDCPKIYNERIEGKKKGRTIKTQIKRIF